MGEEINPGRYPDACGPADIAPTLAHILGFEFPKERGRPDSDGNAPLAARGRSLMARVTAALRQLLGAAPTAMLVHR